MCLVCNHKNNNKIILAKDYFLGTMKEYPYELCNNCSSLSIKQIPEDLNLLYQNYYSFNAPEKISTLKSKIYKYILRHENLLSKLLSVYLRKQNDLPIKSLQRIKLQSSNRILDVGCGSGTFLCQLHGLGFKNCLGIDPFLEADITYPSGLTIKKMSFFDLDEKFDVIMFHHVFEHFSNPKDVLIHISKLLSGSGQCIIRIPDVDSYSFRRFKENWFSIHAPFHLCLPSRKGMAELIKNTGLCIEKTQGEQLVEFFFYSMGHEMGLSDYEKHGNRKFVENYGVKKIPPFHIKNDLFQAKQRLLQVKKYDLCDWIIYYLKKEK